MENILEVKNLRVSFKTYDGLLKVLDGVNLQIRKGEKVGLVGETGCGKTTTLKAIMKILARNAVIEDGSILFKDKDIIKARERELKYLRTKGISMIFQDPTAALNPVYTLGQQLDYILTHSGVDHNRKETALQALHTARLPDPERMYDTYPFQLSGGMRQRACIAMALATNRDLLLADEPTTNLDVTIQDQVLKLIKKLSLERELSLLLITHSLGVAREVTDRIYIMYAGTIIESDSSKTLFENPCHPYTKGLLASLPKLTADKMTEGIPGRIPSYLNPPNGCRFNNRCLYATDRCFKEKPRMFKIDDNHMVACFLFEDGEGQT